MKNYPLLTSIFYLLIFILIPLIACDKDTEENNNSERFILLTTQAWKYDEIITICQDLEIVWFINILDSAVNGKTVIFSSDYSFKSPFENGKWKFNNQETEIITFDDEDPSDIYGHFRIDLLTTQELALTDLLDVTPTDTCYVKSRLVK